MRSSRLAIFFAGLGLVILGAGPLHADDVASIIRRTKSATAIMLLPGDVAGTAFCVDPSGIFVTDLSLAQGFATMPAGKLIIRAGEADEKVVGAQVIRTDSVLGLLQADSKQPYVALDLGDSEQLVETMPVIAVGYGTTPIHQHEDEYPALAFSVRHVELLTRKRGTFNIIGVDVQTSFAGAAGGPMIDTDGKVVGIMHAEPASFPARIAIPSEKLRRLLARPIISFSPPSLTEADSHAARKFTFNVTWLKKPSAKPTVTFLLNPGEKDQRSVEASPAKDDTYEASVVPIEDHPLQLHIAAQFSEGNMETDIVDQDVQVGTTTLRLSKILTVDAERESEGVVKAVVGDKTITGKLQGVEKVAAKLGGATTMLDLSKATHFTVKPIERFLAGIPYKITVSTDGVAEHIEGVIPIKTAPTTSPHSHELLNSLNMKFVRIEPGEFTMGSPGGEAGRRGDEVQHHVLITKPYYIGASHVTRGQFARFVTGTGFKTDAEQAGKGITVKADGSGLEERGGVSWRDPGFPQTDDHPVVMVSWNDAQKFIDWLNAAEQKRHYRLPTEAEWEYAARGGDPKQRGTTTHRHAMRYESARRDTAYFWGDDPAGGAGFANVADQYLKAQLPRWPFAAFNHNDGFVYTSPVGTFKANPLGLFDMAGNAWQWCYDVAGEYPTRTVTDPTGPEQASEKSHVLRGGSWDGSPQTCRSAFRNVVSPGDRYSNIGFRVVMDSD